MGSSAPLGTKSLFNTPGASLPGYVREIARELMKKGKTKSEAVQMAIGICKRWAAEGKPKAVAAIAEWEAAKAKAHATPNKSDLSNPVYAPGRVVLLATPPKESKKKAETRKEEGKLPPGATGWKHGWIPVDDSGKAVGPSQKPAWLKKAEADHKAAGGRDADTIQAEKAKAEFKARADKAAAPAKKAAAEAKRKKAEAESAAKKKTADLKRKTAESERAKKAEDRKAEQKKKDRDALVSKAYKQAIADRKAGRELSEQQRRVVAHVEAQQKKDANKLRGVDVPGADGSKVAAKAPAKKTAAKKVAAKKTTLPAKTAAGKAAAVAKGAATTAVKKAPPIKVKSYTSGLQNRNKSRRRGGVSNLANPYAPWDEGGGVNGTFVMDLANLPKGQLAFRYKHGWILINPAIPSRGRMGGGIARKHGHKSGSVTHGHFEPGAGGKGKKFVPTRSGGPNNPAALKAAHSKLKGAPADQSKYSLVAAQKDSGNALKPSIPSAEKVSSVSKDANAASVKANSSKSLQDAQVAAKKHADAFVQAKKAGDAKLAESHKSNAQAWAKKAQQIKQAEKATADAKAKYEAEQKAKAADDLKKAQEAESSKKKIQDETLEKVKKAHELQKLADGMPENNVPALKAKAQQYKYAADGYADAQKHLAFNGQPASPSLDKNKKAAEENAAKYAKAATEKKEAIQKAQALATDAYDASDDASEAQTAEDYQIAAHAHQKAGKAFQELGMTTEHTMHFDKASQLMKKHHEAKALEEKQAKAAEDAKKAASAPKVEPAPNIAKSNEKMELTQAISGVLDEIEDEPGSLGQWDDFLHAAHAAKKNPTSANLAKMVSAQKALSQAGVTQLGMKDATASLYKKTGLVAPAKKTAAKKTVAQKKTAASPLSPPGAMTIAEKKAAYVDAYKGFLEDGDVAKANDIKAKAIAKGFASPSDFPAAPAPAPAAPVPVPTISLPGPGMYADGNAIVSGKKKADAMPPGPQQDAQLEAVSNAMQEFEKKHGKKFDLSAVEVMNTSTFVPTPSDLTQHPLYADAVAAGYTPVNPETSANAGWKPSDVPGLKSKAGAYHYSGGSYTAINAQLRKYKSATGGDNDAAIAQMDKEFAAVPGLSEPIVTTRRMSDKGPFPEIPPPMEPGVVYQDHGYSSTSKDPGVWSGSVVMQVRIPAGAKVLDLNHTTGSQHANEKEILLNRGSKYRVVSDEKKAGERRIVVELVTE